MFRHLLLLIACISLPAVAAVPDGLSAVLKKHKKNIKGLSIYVSRVDQNSPSVTYNSTTARNPGSVIKILTVATALEKLGPAYVWKTEFYARQPAKNGRIKGPLYIKGHGDPYITVERLWAMIQELRNAGVKHIDGGLVLDDSYFARNRKSTAQFDGQQSRSYNVKPYALLVNFQSLRFRFAPGNGGVDVQTYPKVSTIKVINKLRLTNGRCGIWKYKVNFESRFKRGQEQVILTGKYSRHCDVRYTYRAAQNPANYTAGLFISLWRQQGGTIKSTFRKGRVPDNATHLYSADSLPLASIIRGINKFSNNVMTRHLMLTLIAESTKAPARESRAESMVKQWLRKYKILTRGFRLENGAGLSRLTRVSARQLGKALKVIYRKAYMPELISSLPISGVDGTMLRRRLKKQTQGQMHLKSGLLERVRSVAGYYLNAKGQRYVVVILHNNSRAHSRRAERLHDKILDWIYVNSR